ncbi:unnamed protein product [Cuscuta epithymum]|uniref:CREG-like beta-barrel domain-containing protein n=1 Tax=Cuscuta epithymum TaxID=186058 RepID=A0AAV0FUL7_9ASTE|nr:unnamed protein product [Cuscuta epithymum]
MRAGMAVSLSLSSSAEAISSPNFNLRCSETSSSSLKPIRAVNFCDNACLKLSLSVACTTAPPSRSRVSALSREGLSGGGGTGGEEQAEENFSPHDTNGIGLLSEGALSFSQGYFDGKQTSHEHNINEIPKMMMPLGVSLGSTTGGGGTRAGLFRAPISGGVQSATSAHGLHRPALAVRNLMEQARFAHLCTLMSRMHHRREGYPFGSLVDFVADPMGHPILLLSPLAIHTRNLLGDPRCTLVVQVPGWTGLSNARVTMFGDIYPLPEDQQEWAHKQFIMKHQQGPSQQWANFCYFRMNNISDIYFIGGFGTVAWVDAKEYETLEPDKIVVQGTEKYLKELNAVFSKPLIELLSQEAEVDDVALISIDSKGTDIRVRQGAQFNIQRMSFQAEHSIETLDEAKEALWKLIDTGKLYHLQK